MCTVSSSSWGSSNSFLGAAHFSSAVPTLCCVLGSANRRRSQTAGRHDLYTSQTYSAAIRSGDCCSCRAKSEAESMARQSRTSKLRCVWHSPILRRRCKRADAGLTTLSTSRHFILIPRTSLRRSWLLKPRSSQMRLIRIGRRSRSLACGV